MYQNRFRLWLCPRPRWGAYSAPPGPLAVFKGPTSKGKEGEGEEIRERGGGKGREKGGEGKGKGGEGKNDLTHPLSTIPGYATDSTNRLHRTG